MQKEADRDRDGGCCTGCHVLLTHESSQTKLSTALFPSKTSEVPNVSLSHLGRAVGALALEALMSLCQSPEWHLTLTPFLDLRVQLGVRHLQTDHLHVCRPVGRGDSLVLGPLPLFPAPAAKGDAGEVMEGCCRCSGCPAVSRLSCSASGRCQGKLRGMPPLPTSFSGRVCARMFRQRFVMQGQASVGKACS